MISTGTLIRDARHQAKLSQAQLGQRLGCTPGLISHWEADRKSPVNLNRVASVLGIPEEVLQASTPAPAAQPVASRTRNPPPDSLPEADAETAFVNMSDLLRWIFRTYGFQVQPGKVYEWISDRTLDPPFPAYRNPLRKNPQGEPTLLFRTKEVGPWLDRMIQPLHA
jgi:transcriptional regulator with XRE-family HTH domain